ncbi:DUF1206 domain-containing protein [Devosia sp. 1635]|uniref:DUF1206 domain-containing protein n=1 Tax=Devosia sp. 1635 TaxID=2726066 RepID=UPI0015648020|nr:DUF1206 domain-containing protein [Devosia sp. 1635]
MKNKFELLARWGYAARGIVYVLLGGLALASAFYGAGQQASNENALGNLLGAPFGRVLLSAVAVGLFGYVAWRLAQAFLDADHHGSDAKGLGARAASLISAAGNATLAIAAASLALGAGGQGGSNREDSMTAWLMGQPFGRWLVGAVGIAIIGGGLFQIWRGYSKKYQDRLSIPAEHAGKIHAVSLFGLAARGVLFAVVGVLFVFAALAVDPQQAGSTTEALDYIRHLPFGRILYGLAALGLVAFGLYGLVQARYRRIDAPDLRQAAAALT